MEFDLYCVVRMAQWLSLWTASSNTLSEIIHKTSISLIIFKTRKKLQKLWKISKFIQKPIEFDLKVKVEEIVWIENDGNCFG